MSPSHALLKNSIIRFDIGIAFDQQHHHPDITLIHLVTLILRLHYVPGGPGSPVFARNVACRGVLVICFSDFQDPSRFVGFSYVVLRYP